MSTLRHSVFQRAQDMQKAGNAPRGSGRCDNLRMRMMEDLRSNDRW